MKNSLKVGDAFRPIAGSWGHDKILYIIVLTAIECIYYRVEKGWLLYVDVSEKGRMKEILLNKTYYERLS